MKRYNKVLIKVLSELDKITFGAEIGIWRGANAFHLLREFKDLDLLLVDDYDAGKIKRNGLDPALIPGVRSGAVSLLQDYESRFEWLEMDSIKASERVVDGVLDFVFLDGDHWYEGVKNDIEVWRPKVRTGGILAGHDYSGHFKGVQKAVDEMIGESVTVEGGSIWWVTI